MPTQIVELDDVVPDDIDFRLNGKSYVLPGDVSTDDTFRIQKAIVALAKAELRVAETAESSSAVQEKALAEQERMNREVEALLLKLFQERDPTLESLPFGAVAFQHVLATVLVKLGFGQAIAEAAQEKKEPKRATTVKTKRPRKRSPRSSTSRSS